MDNAKVKKMKNEQAKKRSKIYDLDHTSQRNFSKKVWQSLYFLNNSNHYAEKKITAKKQHHPSNNTESWVTYRDRLLITQIWLQHPRHKCLNHLDQRPDLKFFCKHSHRDLQTKAAMPCLPQLSADHCDAAQWLKEKLKKRVWLLQLLKN